MGKVTNFFRNYQSGAQSYRKEAVPLGLKPAAHRKMRVFKVRRAEGGDNHV